MSDRSEPTGGQGGRLFKNMDEQEQIYAPNQVPDEVMPAHEVDRGENATSGTGQGNAGDIDTTPVAVGLGTGGSAAAATPASDEFDPGMAREERDLQRGDTNVVGPDPRDEQIDPRRTR